jgi:hypothetical protein
MTGIWIAVGIFAIFAIGAAAVQLFAFLADGRRSREVAQDEERLHPRQGRR